MISVKQYLKVWGNTSLWSKGRPCRKEKTLSVPVPPAFYIFSWGWMGQNQNLFHFMGWSGQKEWSFLWNDEVPDQQQLLFLERQRKGSPLCHKLHWLPKILKANQHPETLGCSNIKHATTSTFFFKSKADQHPEALVCAREEVSLSHTCQPPILTLTPAVRIKINHVI